MSMCILVYLKHTGHSFPSLFSLSFSKKRKFLNMVFIIKKHFTHASSLVIGFDQAFPLILSILFFFFYLSLPQPPTPQNTHYIFQVILLAFWNSLLSLPIPDPAPPFSSHFSPQPRFCTPSASLDYFVPPFK